MNDRKPQSVSHLMIPPWWFVEDYIYKCMLCECQMNTTTRSVLLLFWMSAFCDFGELKHRNYVYILALTAEGNSSDIWFGSERIPTSYLSHNTTNSPFPFWHDSGKEHNQIHAGIHFSLEPFTMYIAISIHNDKAHCLNPNYLPDTKKLVPQQKSTW